MNYKKKIKSSISTKALKDFAKQLRKTASGMGSELPFGYKDGKAYIEDTLVDVAGYELYDGIIPVDFSVSSWNNQPADPDVGYFSAVHSAEGVNNNVNYKKALIIKYNSPDGLQLRAKTLMDIVNNGEATIVEGEEKKDVIDTFLGMFEEEICEYLEEHEVDDYDGPDDY